MKKSFKTREVVAIYQAITELMNSEIKFPGQVLWNLRLNYKELEAIVKTYEECIKAIQKEFIDDKKFVEDKDQDGNSIVRVKPEYQNELVERIVEIESQSTEVTVRTIPYRLVAGIDFTGKQWSGVEFMLEDDSKI